MPWCETCYGTGSLDCLCGGDICVCGLDTYPCPACHGEYDEDFEEEGDEDGLQDF